MADTVPDTDVSHASAVLEYGSVIPSDQYKIKRIQWKETYNTNTTVSRFSDSAARYLVIVTLETTDGDFWNIPSNYIAEINGFAATVENQGDGTLEISAYVHTLPAVELNQYWLDGEDLSLDRIWWEYGYKSFDIFLDFDFPQSLESDGYTFRIDYREEYFLEGKDKPYTTLHREYDFHDVKEIADGTYRMTAPYIGDKPGREMAFYADVYLIPPEGKGAEVLARSVASRVQFLEMMNSTIRCWRAVNPGGKVSVKLYNDEFESDTFTRVPYFYDGFSFNWTCPPDPLMNTANGKNASTAGTMYYKMRVFVNDVEQEVITTKEFDSEKNEYNHNTSLKNPLIGEPDETKTIRAEIYGWYSRGAADGTKETEPLRTFTWDIKYTENISATRYEYIESVSVNGITVEEDETDKEHPYHADVQAYLPQQVSFEFKFPNEFDMDTDVLAPRVFLKQEGVDSAEGITDSVLGAGYKEITKKDCEYIGENMYRYTADVYGRPGVTDAPVTLEIWAFSAVADFNVSPLVRHTVYLSFKDKQDLFAIKVDADGNESPQSFLSVQVQRWDGFDDERYTTAHQNAVGALLRTDSILPFEMRFIYRLPSEFPAAHTDMRYSLIPKLYYRASTNQEWVEYDPYTELKIIDENRYQVFFNLQKTYVTGRRQYRLDLYAKTPYGTLTDTKIPYSFYVNVDFNSNDANLAKGVIVNDTQYAENDPTVHLDAKVPTLQFRYYLPKNLYDANYRIVMKETFGGTTKYYYPESANYAGLKYPDNGYGYQTYTYQTKLNATAGGTIMPKLELLLWEQGSSSTEKSVGVFTPTLKYDATPVYVCGIELKDGQYIKGGGDQTVYTGTPDPNKPGRDGYAYNNGGTLTLNKFYAMKIQPIGTDPDYYQYSYIYKKDLGDLRIRLIGSNNFSSIKTDSTGYGIYVRNGDLIIEGTSSDSLSLTVMDGGGEYSSGQKGIQLVEGSLTIRGTRVTVKAGTGIDLNSNNGKFTMETFVTVNDSGESVSYSPVLGIQASSVGLKVLENTVVDIRGGTFSVKATDYDGKVSNEDKLQYKQTNYTNGYSTIIAGDSTGEWIYDMNTTYTGSEGDSVYEINGTVLKSLRLVKGAGCIAVGDKVLEEGRYLYYENGELVVRSGLPTEDWNSYAYNDNGDLTLHNFTYSGAGCITDRPTNPAGHMPDLTFIINLEGKNSITNTGKAVGQPWHPWSGAYGIAAQNDLRLEGSGNLTIHSENGILYFNNLTVNDGSIEINATKNGIYAGSDANPDVSDTYLQNSIMTVNGGTVVIAASKTGVNGFGTIRVINGELEITSTTRTVMAYSSYWYTTFDLDKAKTMKVYVGNSKTAAEQVPYTTDEEICNRFANVAYNYTKFVGDNGILEIDVENYTVGTRGTEVCTVYKSSAGEDVRVSIYDMNEYWYTKYLQGDQQYKILVKVQYPSGTPAESMYSELRLTVPTINGKKTYTIDAGTYNSSGTVSDYCIIDPPAGTPVNGFEMDLGGYEPENTALDLDIAETATSHITNYEISLYSDINGVRNDTAMNDGDSIEAGSRYWIGIKATLNTGHYLSEGTAAAQFKLNGISASELVKEEDVLDYWRNYAQQAVTLYFRMPAAESGGTAISGTVTTFGDPNETTTIRLMQDGIVIDTHTFSGSNIGSYSFENVTAGEYVIEVSKKNHVTREYRINVK
ncbi:MAG: carbohydrate-binding domain-containing protein [Clostridia bacterium]|nr:carbohydrate-binding domain-containing protein [Clostridia bacterium]